jgi:hypothetical protein
MTARRTQTATFTVLGMVSSYNEVDNMYLTLHSRAGRFGTKGLAITFQSSESDQQVMSSIQARFEVAIPELPEHIDPANYSALSLCSFTRFVQLSYHVFSDILNCCLRAAVFIFVFFVSYPKYYMAMCLERGNVLPRYRRRIVSRKAWSRDIIMQLRQLSSTSQPLAGRAPHDTLKTTATWLVSSMARNAVSVRHPYRAPRFMTEYCLCLAIPSTRRVCFAGLEVARLDANLIRLLGNIMGGHGQHDHTCRRRQLKGWFRRPCEDRAGKNAG